MGKSIGLAIDFSRAGFTALNWADKYLLPTLNNREDKIYIIHIKPGNNPHLIHDKKFNQIEDLKDHYPEGNWNAVIDTTWNYKSIVSVKVYEGEDIPAMLKHVSDDVLRLNTLIVGSATLEDGGGPNTSPQVSRYLVDHPTRCSIVISKEL
ncbi:uncharacterized protein LOC133925484 [Phragmites australis]|uniref:uncharacterized protein LOC133925484 n=1 Tax=Phragmites australis TaxID=29695 RepID=UPI002D798814|nr:uncharacterized protein LOC133925484 [Phragmites australis]